MKTRIVMAKYGLAILLAITGVYCLTLISSQIQLSWSVVYLLLGGLMLISAGTAVGITKKQLLLNTTRIFSGILFIYSGFVKAVDPLGSKYKFTDYFDAWGLGFMEPTAFVLGIILSTLELGLGLSLLFNIKIKWASPLAMLFMLGFTPVTLYLAMQEQVSGQELVHDCGCFGDSLVLTNWQTFVKNIIILIPVSFVFIKRKQIHTIFRPTPELIAIGIFISISVIISIHAYMHLPAVDFRPYYIGANLRDGIKGIPDEEEQWAKFKNLQTGEIKEFEIIRNYPDWNVWEYITEQDIRVEITKKGKAPSIHDFLITSDASGDVTDSILLDTSYNFMFISYDINQASTSHMDEMNKLHKLSKSLTVPFRAISASLKEETDAFKDKTGAKFNFYKADPITLKTIVRSNPGLVLVKNGVVIDKWHHNDLPDADEMKKILER